MPRYKISPTEITKHLNAQKFPETFFAASGSTRMFMDETKTTLARWVYVGANGSLFFTIRSRGEEDWSEKNFTGTWSTLEDLTRKIKSWLTRSAKIKRL